MGAFPVVVPELPEARSEVVPARLARKLGPLFGAAWPEGPFGTRTWVCDYNKVTLSEIARGAPLPPRGQAGSARAGVADWAVVDRVAISADGAVLPDVVPNATLGRFGPDTKAAVVLTGANLLLAPATAAVAAGVAALRGADGAPLGTRARAVAWAALVLEVFRSQPALVGAALRARSVQRELLVDWHLPLVAPGVALTRCEIGAPTRDGARDTASRPRDLAVLDDTAAMLAVGEPELVADRLARELIEIGSRRSAAHLWLAERSPGQLVVEALVPPTEIVSRFADGLGSTARRDDDHRIPLPRLPDAAALTARPLAERRAVLLAVLAVLRDLRFDGEERERLRGELVGLLRGLDAAAEAVLGDGDPVGAVIRARVADMVLQTCRHDVRNDLAGPLATLRARVERCVALADAGVLDRGAAAEAVSSANVEVNVVRRTNAADPAAGLPAPEELDAWLRGTWSAFLRALQWDDADETARAAAGHHVHNYASYLATHPDRPEDLRAAVTLFTEVVLPARARYAERTGSSLPLRQSLQTASRATTTLATRATAVGRPVEAAQWAARGLEWITEALGQRETRELLRGTSEPAAHFALLAAPALLTAVETAVAGAGKRELACVDELLGVAGRWVERVTGGAPRHYSRAGELTALRSRRAAARTAPA